MSTNLVIYHQTKTGVDCPDGITSAAIAAEALGNADLLGYCYNMPLPDIDWQKYKSIYVVDFSFPLDVMKALLLKNSNSNVVVIDHHKTAAENLKNITGCYSIFDLSRSASELTWDYFHPGKPCPGIVLYVGDRDMWKWNLPDSKKINCALSNLRLRLGGKQVYQQYRSFSLEQLHNELLPLGQKIYQARQQRIAELATSFKYGFDFINKEYFLVGEIPEIDSYLTSDLAENLYLNELRPLGYVVIYGENSFGVSLRSRQGSEVDVSRIAKKFGGGGHFHAAGFSRKNLKEYPLRLTFWGQVEGFIRKLFF